MKTNLIGKLKKSLFLKILALFVLAHFTIVAFSITTHKTLLRKARHPRISQYKIHYGYYLIKELGSPPDTLKAREIAASHGIQIRFENAQMQWTSHKPMLDFDQLKQPALQEKRRTHAGYQRGAGLYVDIQQDQGRYLFILRPENEMLESIATLNNILNIVFMTLVIIGIYFAMRWLLKPVTTLHEGVQQLSRGNLEYVAPAKRSDELGLLVQSFNQMTARIKKMIQAKERLLLDVSHELRSPLTRVKVALELLENSKAKQNIHSDVSEMETMITEILESQRLNSEYGGVMLQRTDLAAVLKEVCAEFQQQKPGVKLRALRNSVQLDLDPERTRILFKNIISNAVKYSATEGKAVEISLQDHNGEVVVSVQDFGAGIPEEDLPHIFEPFYRVDKSRSKSTGGYGLGMNLSKNIMEAHGGNIEINSKLKVGTTVYLKFKKSRNK